MQKYILFLLIPLLLASEYCYAMQQTSNQIVLKQNGCDATKLIPTQCDNVFVQMCVSDLCLKTALSDKDINNFLCVHKHQGGTYNTVESSDTIFNTLFTILNYINSNKEQQKSSHNSEGKGPKLPMEFHGNICIGTNTSKSLAAQLEIPVWENNVIPAKYDGIKRQFTVLHQEVEHPEQNLLETVMPPSTIEIRYEENVLSAKITIPKEGEDPLSLSINNFNKEFFDFIQKVTSNSKDLFLIIQHPNPKCNQIHLVIPILKITSPLIALSKILLNDLQDNTGTLIRHQENFFSVIYGIKKFHFVTDSTSLKRSIDQQDAFSITLSHTNKKPLTITITAVKTNNQLSQLSITDKIPHINTEITSLSYKAWKEQKKEELEKSISRKFDAQLRDLAHTKNLLEQTRVDLANCREQNSELHAELTKQKTTHLNRLFCAILFVAASAGFIIMLKNYALSPIKA